MKNRFGQSLIEVVIALAVVVALAISLVTASLVTQRTSRSASSNTEATKLVQQLIEQVRVMRDRKGFVSLVNNNYSCIKNTNQDPLNWAFETMASNCPNSGLVTLANVVFTPSIVISNGTDPAKQKKIKVTVSWTDSSGIQSVSNDTVLSNCVSTTTSC